MAGLPVTYPETLPHPEVGQFTPRERRAINREFMRPISRDRAGTRSVAFTFTPAQAREFREWYQEWVTMGGGMFAAPWPMPWGRGPHVFRFVEPPTWQLIGGGIDGQGYWRVTADVELRGRGEMPMMPAVIITSEPYSMFIRDDVFSSHLLTSGALFRAFQDVDWGPEDVEMSHALTGGTLKSLINEYEMEPESVEAAHTLVSGTLKSVIRECTFGPEEIESSHALTGGALIREIVDYSHFGPEEIEASHTLTGGTLHAI